MRAEWIYVSVVLCFFSLQWQELHGSNHRDPPTCEQICKGLNVPNGCKHADKSSEKFMEEVIVVTDGTSDIASWDWDNVHMVVSEYFASTRTTGYTACYTHSQGRRYGLRERVPYNITELVQKTSETKTKFAEMITTYRTALMADHVVYDLLAFFQNLRSVNSTDREDAITAMNKLLLYVIGEVKKQHNRESYCIVPWEPPCQTGQCGNSSVGVQQLLALCDYIMLSPDSYLPVADSKGFCEAQATVPISKFLYGIDRYIGMRPNGAFSIVAGIPWHGYVYSCDGTISDNKCKIKPRGGVCFNKDNRQRRSLSEIHRANPPEHVYMDVVTKGVYYNLNSTAQLWYENFTTLLIKYQLVKDLQLRGLSLWYGEDLAVGLSTENARLSSKFWSFLTHNVLHTTVYNPKPVSHYYADTVAGVGVGCLLLGTLLGTVFTCIGFKHSRIHRLNRPFKLDEDDNAFRDDEGL